MDSDTISPEDRGREKHTESGYDIDIDFLLKKGKLTDEDIENIIRDIGSDPDDRKTLLEILRLDDEPADVVDGAPIESSFSFKNNMTFVGLMAAVDDTQFKHKDTLLKHCLSNRDLIPSSILARGIQAIKAYGRALKRGKTYDKRVQVMLIGQNKGGKTSLGRSLRGEPFRHDEQRTGGIQINEPLVNASREKPWKYSRRRFSAYDNNCAKLMHQELLSRRKAVEEKGTKSTDDICIEKKSATRDTTAGPQHVDGNCSTSPEVFENKELEVIPEGIACVLEESLEHDEEDTSNGIWPVILELAGEGVDQAMHPIFMIPDAVYLLVFDLSKDMFEKEANESDSSLDHIMKCVDKVHSLKQATDDSHSPPVFLVGTRADCVTDVSKAEKMELLSRNTLIQEHVLQQFDIDNTKAGRAPGEEDRQIVSLRGKVIDVAKEMPHTKKEIPLHWVEIESNIEDNVTNGEKFMSKGKFKKDFVDRVCTLEERKDVNEILHFLHNRGTIAYHDTGEDGLVVLDPQWLLNIIRQILNVDSNQEETMKARKNRRVLKEEGILAAEHLDSVCESLGVGEIKQFLVSIMKRFNLICPLENRSMYLVPCMLPKTSETDIIHATSDGGPLPVYLTFKTHYVPMGLFPKLLSLLRGWAASKTSCEQQQTFANAACFILHDKNFLGLVCYKSVIKLQVWSQGNSNGASRCLSEVYSFLETSLAVIRDTCHWLSSLSCELSIRCYLCGGKEDTASGLCRWHGRVRCADDDCAHYIPLKAPSYYCPRAKGLEKIIPEEKFDDWRSVLENNNIQKRKPSTVPSPMDQFEQDKSKVQVTLLAGEWGSSKGGLPTVNRLLAKELAKHRGLEVTLYVAECREEDRTKANSYGIHIVKAKERPGYGLLDRLGFRPHEGFLMDVVIGHGVKLGKQAQLLQQFYPKCVWVQFEHTAPEELAIFKSYGRRISIGEEKHETEVQLSKMADLVVAVGPKLAEVFRTYLRPYPEKKVFEIVPSPSIFQEFAKCEQAKHDGEKFKVLVFGRGDKEDFELKGYDIAPKAIAELNDDHKYHLYFVGAARGDLENVTERLLKHGIPKSQLTVRGFIESREKLAEQLCEVDLAIMPSRTEGFGLTALEALTAGLPILVGANSGFAEALKKLQNPPQNPILASSCIVESEDGQVWASAIRAVKERNRSKRLKDAQTLKACYDKTFSWSEQCKSLSRMILGLVRDKRNEDDVNQAKAGHVEKDAPDSPFAEESSDLPIEEKSKPRCGQDVPRQIDDKTNFTRLSETQSETTRRRRSKAKKPNRHIESVKRQRSGVVKPMLSILLLLAFALVLLVFSFGIDKDDTYITKPFVSL